MTLCESLVDVVQIKPENSARRADARDASIANPSPDRLRHDPIPSGHVRYRCELFCAYDIHDDHL